MFSIFFFRMLGSVVILGKACDLIDQHKSRRKTSSQSSNEAPGLPMGSAAEKRVQQFEHAMVNPMATKSKEEANRELRQAAVALEAKIQTMFGPRLSKDDIPSQPPPSTKTQQCEDNPRPHETTHHITDQENDDRIVSIAQTNQQLAPFCHKLNSKPTTAGVNSQQIGGGSTTSAAAAAEESSDFSQHKEPDSWSERRSQLLAARQNFSDSRRRPLSCTPPSTSASQSLSVSIDDGDDSAAAAVPAAAGDRQISSDREVPLASDRVLLSSLPHQMDERQASTGECGLQSVGRTDQVVSLETDSEGKHENYREKEELKSRGMTISKQTDGDGDCGGTVDAAAAAAAPTQTCQQNFGSSDDSSSSFRPKCMSSPDFLKTYRNKSDWPELSDESEEDEEDSNPEVDMPPGVKDISRAGSSNNSRRKRCETVASAEQI